MELVKTPIRPVRKRAAKMHIDKSAKLLSLISRVLKNMYGPARLQELIEDLSPRDRAMFLCHFIKPEKPKDEFERLDDQALEKLANLVTERARRAAYK